MNELERLKQTLLDFETLVEELREKIEDLEYNTPEAIADREAQRKHREEHPEQYDIFNVKLWSKKILEQFKKEDLIDAE
mgnify:CR=1 FL=1